jgi:hypothetical protein
MREEESWPETAAIGRGDVGYSKGIEVHAAFIQFFEVFLLVAIGSKHLHKEAVVRAG